MTEPRILIVGGEKGSWQIRGRQLGAALQARAVAKPKPSDWANADVIILVKRAPQTWFREATATGVPIIWDVLDFWHQPSGNQRLEADLVREVLEMAHVMKAHMIGATRAMAAALKGAYLPHHSRSGLVPTPSRPELKVVAYEGAPRYLGSWRSALEDVCEQLGLTFVVNPPELGQADLVVAFRGEEWDGWACRQWKSGIKYVNAIAAGRPILSQATAAFDEIQPGGTIVENPADLSAAIAALAPADVRDRIYTRCRKRAHEFSLDAIAAQYRKLIHSVVGVAA